MANPLKQLAGETAVYGLSTILARIINFLFVPIYTRMLTTDSYGVVTEFMAYIAVLQVVLTLGLETGCFRFANKESGRANVVYSNALATVTGLCSAFLACVIIFAKPIAGDLGYGGYGNCIIYIGLILVLDCITAILFAKLRQEHKALKFAILKTIKILTETGANLFLFFWYPTHVGGLLGRFISPTPDFTYVIFAILAGSVLCSVLFIPDIFKMSFEMDRKLLRQMLAYSLPLMAASLPGIVNDFLDRILFRYFDTSADSWRSSLGIFQAAVKLSVIMNLFIQMFRFAAEPFFFQRAKDKGSKQLYASVMEFFTAFCGLIFLGICLYIDIISLLLGRDFRVGIGVVPVMLLSYMLLGMLFNVSMWYKLSEKTQMAIWITLAGLVVTTVVNVTLMPSISYWAAAIGHLCSYIVMFVISAVLGAKYYPVPYRWGRLALTFVVMLVLYGISTVIDLTVFNGVSIADGFSAMALAKEGIHTLLILVYCALLWKPLRSLYRQTLHGSEA